MKWYKVWTADLSAPVLIIKAASLREAISMAKKESPAYTLGEEYKKANKCENYRRQQIRERRITLTGRPYYVDITVGICYGVKNTDRCTCNGKPELCDFYPEKRKQ